MILRNLVFAASLAFPTAAFAQSGGTAHLYAYRLSDRPAFEQGYRTHLRWHAAHADRLAWFAWYVTAGTRKGAFVDGTFGTTQAGLDSRPDPDGDGADFGKNAAPYASAIGNEGWELWKAASSRTPLEQRRPDAAVHVYLVKAHDAKAFEKAVLAKPVPDASWYRSIDGKSPSYLLMVPAASAWSAPDLAASLRANPAALSLVQAERDETWDYAPRLALMPGSRIRR